jgi:hypothetical protein
MAEIINTIPLDPITFEFQDYSISDTSLITFVEVENTFNPQTDHIEYFVYDLNGNILTSNTTGYNGYRLLDNVLTIYPDIDLTTQGYTEGQYNTLYNFVSNKLASNPTNTYYISEIGPDRTEVRLDTTFIPNVLVIDSSLELTNNIATSTGSYYDFYLNFGDNQLVIANNILLDTSSINNPTVLIKLYEALPQQFDINSQCWVVTQVATPVAYNINITQTFDVTNEYIYLKGPNTNLNIKNQINNSTDYSNSSQLSVTDSTQGSGSLRYQLNSLLAKTGIEINIDYSNYDNFIHFSSAQTRLENFYYKLSLIEQYNYSASYSSTTSANYYVSSSNVVWQSKINEIITGFDNYEYFLYFNSGSASWPKTGSTPPYTNYTTTSTSGSNWFVSQSAVAEEYDIENNNALINAIPSYLLEDPANAQYELFIEMIGQHFDNIFLYTQDITNKYNADNRVNYGVSKDLVADILRDMGIKIYQNNFSTNDLYSALLGLTPSGSLYNLPYTTGSLPTPAGYEYINTYITASATGSLIPTEDINAEIYKRIYANLPYLLKKKGTVEGLRALITTYGIPDTILQVNEFGGQDKIIENDYDLWFDQYNFAYYTSGSSYISSSFSLNTSWNADNDVPQAVEFRFRTDGLPQNTASIASQSLWETDTFVKLVLKYTGSGYTSGSYSGSIVNPYNQYAKLDLIPDPTSPQTSASIYLPFYNGEWWSVLVNKVGSVYTLYAKDKNYKGEDGNTIGFQASSSVDPFTEDPWNNAVKSYFGISSSLAGKYFSGSFQEIRYYVNALDSSSFNDYVMNPYSIDANGVNTAPTDLAFRASLGGELYTSSISIHPKVTGSWKTTASFASNSNFYVRPGGTYIPNTEIFYLNQFPAGIKNRVSNKIRQQGEILPYSGSNEVNLPTNQVLSPFISVQQSVAVSGSYTPNIDYVEVAFSPQNQINNDIAGQLGYFNIGEYIGDPRLVSSSAESYPALNDIRDYYFEKYTGNYNIWDYIRLIKYFDNSLFKMIADWTPARTDLASGIVIKQTTLERNKYPVPQPNITSSIAWVESGSYVTDTLFNLTNAAISPTGSYTVFAPHTYNFSTTFTGSFNNVSGFDGSDCYIYYYTPDALAGPPIVLLALDGVNSLRTGDEVSFNFSYNNIVSGSKIEFSCNSSVGSVLLDAYVTGSGFEATNIPYEVEDLLITGSSIQMYTITGSSGGSIVDTETLVYSTSSFNLTTGNSITFNLSSSGAERVLCRISSSAEDVFNAVVTLSNQGTTVYSNSDPKFNYTLNETFNISSGYLTISNNSDAATLTISGLEVYQQPSYYQTVETVYGLNQILIPNEFDFNGELQGSEILVTDGDLNGGNPFLKYPTQEYKYDIIISSSDATGLSTWLSAPINNGELHGFYLVADEPGFPYGLTYAKISKTSLNSLDATPTLEDLQNFRIDILSPLGIYETHTIVGVQEQATYYIFTLIIDSLTYTIGTYSNRLVVFSPTDSVVFVNSNYDVLVNNAVAARFNNEFFDVDFSTNAITAVNRVNVISASRGTGSATPSTTPASNYTTARIANPRYIGSKNTSPDFNIITDQQLPSVEKYTSYFIYTPGGSGNTLAERSGSGNYKIGFLVDELGNIIQPENDNSDSVYLPNLLNAFGADSTVILSPNSSSTIKQSEFTIYKPAVVSNIIMFSDTGSLGNNFLVSGTYANLTFEAVPGLYTQPYGLNVTYPGQVVDPSFPQIASFNSIILDQAGGFNTTTSIYTVQNTSPIRAAISASFKIINNQVSNTSVQIKLFENNVPISQQTQTVLGSAGSANFVVTASVSFTSGSQYYIDISSSVSLVDVVISPAPPSWTITPLTSSVSISKNIWLAGSNSVLTSSVAFANLYGAYQQILPPVSNGTSSGFDQPQPLTFLPYDEIRWEGNETIVNTILSSSIGPTSIFGSTGNSVYLFLQQPYFPTGSVDINYYAIRRWIPSIDNIIINSPGTVMGSGFIFPKYPSPLLRANLPSIIENLTNKGLV